jgi:uncharacterized protein (DUF983 family)
MIKVNLIRQIFFIALPLCIMATLKSTFLAKCPKCCEGDMFIDKNPYHLKNYDKMNKYCNVCNFDFENETGFYYGAMYVSYALSVGFSLINFAIYMAIFRTWDFVMYYVLVNSILLVLLLPFIFRFSRSLYLVMMDKLFPNEGDTPDSV